MVVATYPAIPGSGQPASRAVVHVSEAAHGLTVANVTYGEIEQVVPLRDGTTEDLARGGVPQELVSALAALNEILADLTDGERAIAASILPRELYVTSTVPGLLSSLSLREVGGGYSADLRLDSPELFTLGAAARLLVAVQPTDEGAFLRVALVCSNLTLPKEALTLIPPDEPWPLHRMCYVANLSSPVIVSAGAYATLRGDSLVVCPSTVIGRGGSAEVGPLGGRYSEAGVGVVSGTLLVGGFGIDVPSPVSEALARLQGYVYAMYSEHQGASQLLLTDLALTLLEGATAEGFESMASALLKGGPRAGPLLAARGYELRLEVNGATLTSRLDLLSYLPRTESASLALGEGVGAKVVVLRP
ncbi:MAG TPA: hypothetical protein EYP90_02755, partial [Chromatiaceae bacterium]|nr:hypothetical protein [Chromatiaceae bacterium]